MQERRAAADGRVRASPPAAAVDGAARRARPASARWRGQARGRRRRARGARRCPPASGRTCGRWWRQGWRASSTGRWPRAPEARAASRAPPGDDAERRRRRTRSTRWWRRWRAASRRFLLHGVTGSGKTEVYLRVIAAARAAGQGALVLVPEIALTPQLAARFRARFGDDVAVLHSALPPTRAAGGLAAAARRRGRHRARRALGGVRAGARARRRRRRRGARPVVQAGGGGPLPRARPGGGARAARGRARDPRLGDAVAGEHAQRRARAVHAPRAARARDAAAAARGRDRRSAPPPARPRRRCCRRRWPRRWARRWRRASRASCSSTGAASRPCVLCHACGHVVRCPSCAVSLTYHRGRARLMLPLLRPHRSPSPSAARRASRRASSGWAPAPSASRRSCASASPTRASRASIATPPASGRCGSGLDAMLARMHAGEIDILVGTQMVTKGHDFPGVTLVGVLQPDQAMNLPDFRAAERTFQLLEQVAGRAGRGDRPGRVHHPDLQARASGDRRRRDARLRGLRARASWRRARSAATRRSRA